MFNIISGDLGAVGFIYVFLYPEMIQWADFGYDVVVVTEVLMSYILQNIKATPQTTGTLLSLLADVRMP